MPLSEITGYCGVAEVRFGSNGDPQGYEPECLVGDAQQNVVSTSRIWDSSPSNGIDSGAVSTAFTAAAGGGAGGVSWSVAGGATDPLSFSGVTYGTISSVKIRAAVTGGGMRMRFASLVVMFFKAGTLQQTKVIAIAPDANTLANGSSGGVEKIATVTPTASDNDAVVVTGTVQLVANSGVAPNATSIFGQIFLFANQCAVT